MQLVERSESYARSPRGSPCFHYILVSLLALPAGLLRHRADCCDKLKEVDALKQCPPPPSGTTCPRLAVASIPPSETGQHCAHPMEPYLLRLAPVPCPCPPCRCTVQWTLDDQGRASSSSRCRAIMQAPWSMSHHVGTASAGWDLGACKVDVDDTTRLVEGWRYRWRSTDNAHLWSFSSCFAVLHQRGD